MLSMLAMPRPVACAWRPILPCGCADQKGELEIGPIVPQAIRRVSAGHSIAQDGDW